MYDLMKALFIICNDLNHSSVVYRLILSYAMLWKFNNNVRL